MHSRIWQGAGGFSNQRRRLMTVVDRSDRRPGRRLGLAQSRVPRLASVGRVDVPLADGLDL